MSLALSPKWLTAISIALAPHASIAMSRPLPQPSSLDVQLQQIEPTLPSSFGEAASVSDENRAFADRYVFVAYPSAPGIQSDVFIDNFDALAVDFGVPRERMIQRDIRGFEARYGEGTSSPASKPPHFQNPPGTFVLADSSEVRATSACGLQAQSGGATIAREAAFLRRIRDEFQRPVIVMCHSAFCPAMYGGALAAHLGISGAPIVGGLVYMQSASPGSSVSSTITGLNSSLSGAKFGEDGCAIERALDPNSDALRSLKALFILGGGMSVPNNWGRNLGALRTVSSSPGRNEASHLDPVVSERRAGSPARYRRALMHVVMTELARD